MVKEMPASLAIAGNAAGVGRSTVAATIAAPFSSDLRVTISPATARQLQDLHHQPPGLSAIPRTLGVDSRTIEAFEWSRPSFRNHRHGIGGELPGTCANRRRHVRSSVSVA